MAKNKGKKKKNIAKVIISLAIMVAIGGAVFLYTSGKSLTTVSSTYTVRSEVFEKIIEVSGTVEAEKSQSLKVAGDGTVEAVFVEEGDFIREGTIILQLNSAEQEYSLAQLDYFIEQKQINGSAKEVELMQKERDMIIDQLEDRQVIASFDGIVAHLDVAVADVFEAKDEIGTLINRDYLSVAIEVAETDVSRLAIGQSVNMIFSAYADEVIMGTVVSWPSVGRITDSGAIVVDVEVRIDNPPDEILPNYSFIGNIEMSPPETVLLVENVTIAKDGKQNFVEIIQKDGSVVTQNVMVTTYDRSYVKILEGLQEGDELKSQGRIASGGAQRQPADVGGIELRIPGGGLPSGGGGRR